METWCLTAMWGIDFNIPITCHVPPTNFFFIYLFILHFNWRLITLQYCGVFCLFVCLFCHILTRRHCIKLAVILPPCDLGTISEVFAFHKSPPFCKWHPSTLVLILNWMSNNFMSLAATEWWLFFAHVHLLCRLFCDTLILGAWEREYVSKKIFRRTHVNPLLIDSEVQVSVEVQMDRQRSQMTSLSSKIHCW